MKLKSQLMTEDAMDRALKRMAHQIAERNNGCQNVVFLGIKRKGVPLAKRLAENVKNIEGIDVKIGIIDITHYRDDLSELAKAPIINETLIDFDINGKDVVLVDDVLYTGRTVRAALDAVSKFGRAKTIQLAVLIDRGHRELPIRADYVGKNVPTSRNETISVRIDDYNGQTCVNLYEKDS
ncbi:MAG: bifunctional pyr operon transcriptional regulator/uracil phosphoribosyltransferase PyrR [Eubacteriales bacterium]|nr:bifunctional pyr operon transcriptional regulator/uracil phosphoribosyltransferase PyrR [Eubacteriales bacterium]